MIKTLYFLVFAKLVSVVTLSAQTLSGTVRSAETKQPMPYAHVHLQGSRKGAITGAEGAFSFTVTPEEFDKGRLVTSFVGYLSLIHI